MRRAARAGTTYPFAVEVDGEFAGQLTINNIVRGSAQFASAGYWIDQRYAGRGVIPRALAMAVDHCFTAGGLHRIEVAIRPENTNSLRVVEKLGFHEVGYAPRFLHIDGDWRDHRLYAITREEVPDGCWLASRDSPRHLHADPSFPRADRWGLPTRPRNPTSTNSNLRHTGRHPTHLRYRS